MASAASAEEECVRLKDEMDSLREALSKASHYENQMRGYQKKLEQMADLQRNLKMLEEKHEELIKVCKFFSYVLPKDLSFFV